MDQRQQAALPCGGFRVVAPQAGVGHGDGLPGRGIGHHADDALAAHGHDGHGQRVLAGVDVQLAAAEGDQVHHLGHAAAGFLDGGDAGVFRQLCRGGGQQVAAGAARHVIEDDGDGGCVRHGGEVGDEALLRGLVVIRCDRQQRVGARLAGVADVFQDVEGVVRADAGDDGHAARHAVYGEADDFRLFRELQGGAFTGGAHGHDGVDAGGELKVDETAQSVVVHGEVVLHGRDDGGGGAFENRVLHNGCSFPKTAADFALYGYYMPQLLQ